MPNDVLSLKPWNSFYSAQLSVDYTTVTLEKYFRNLGCLFPLHRKDSNIYAWYSTRVVGLCI